jgi:hypothetical protein
VPWAVGSVVMIPKGEVSGRQDSNPQLSAWEADVLPLNQSRASPVLAIGSRVLYSICPPNSHSGIAWGVRTLKTH